MRPVRFLLIAFLLTFGFSLGCRAQTPGPATGKELDRRIEIQVRGEMNLPPEISITVGQRTKSEFPGYDTLPITFSRGQATKQMDFLISTDNKTVIKWDRIDISKDPATLIDSSGRSFRGGADAKVVVVNFDDLECPYCARMHKELFPETLARYGDKVKIVYKDFPLVEIHPWAMHAAIDANCLAAQNGVAYWNYVDYVHEHGDEVNGPNRNITESQATLDKLARDEGKKNNLDAAKLDACIQKQDDAVVRASMGQGDKLGIGATPTLFINGERVEGAEGTEVLWPVIDRALRDAGVQPPPAPPSSAPFTKPGPPPQGK